MAVIEHDESEQFSPDSFAGLNSAEAANAALRTFSRQATRYRYSLIRQNVPSDKIDSYMETLWDRIITACKKFGVPCDHVTSDK